jgi:hypothetical protein
MNPRTANTGEEGILTGEFSTFCSFVGQFWGLFLPWLSGLPGTWDLVSLDLGSNFSPSTLRMTYLELQRYPSIAS